jgi:AGCS family alanine or glycine:cation symporter
LAYYYIAETNVTYINRAVHRPWLMIFLKWLVLTSVMYGGIKSADLAWALGDVGVGAMAWLNIVAILILQRPALLALKDYETQLKDGFDPTFDAEAAGIDNADFWVKPKVK